MNKFFRGVLCAWLLFLMAGMPVRAEEENRILPGIYIEDMSLEGKTAAQAKSMVEGYVSGLSGKTITLLAIDGNEVPVILSDLGFRWKNQEIVEEAAKIGQEGNVVQRYKAAKDLQYYNKVYTLEFDVDRKLLRTVLTEQCAVYNEEARDASLTRENGSFTIVPGQRGRIVDEEASIEGIIAYLNQDWDREAGSVELTVTVKEPRGSEEELSKVKDVLGTFSTSYKTSGSSRSANVSNGCRLINGTTLYPGDEFSTYEAVSPFSEANGYYMAGSYLNGQVVDSLGGGICQVSTTLYNAVLLSELEVTERHNHSMIVTYVDPSADAAIAESSGKDFKFVNNTQAPIYIEGTTTDDKQISFTIYGQETRSSARQVRYESEVVSRTNPDSEVIYANEGLPVGSISVQSAHIGYKANLWKIVTENGAEISREMVNSSSYQMVPRTATVGVATADPNIHDQVMAAIATNNIDHVKNVVTALAAGTEPPAPPVDAAQVQPPADAAAQAQPPADAAQVQPPADGAAGSTPAQ